MTTIKLVDDTELTLKELATADSHGTPRAMTSLREKTLNPEDIPKELFSLKDLSGISVLDICIERFQEQVNILMDGEKNFPRPILNKNHPVYNDPLAAPRALALANSFTGCLLPDHFFRIKEILKITQVYGQTSVAHVLARIKKLPIDMMTPDILSLTCETGCSVAYEVLSNYHFLPEYALKQMAILLLENGYNEYVVHFAASIGLLSAEALVPEILLFKNKYNRTVLDLLIKEKHLTPEIIALPINNKFSVFNYLMDSLRNGKLPPQENAYVKTQIQEFVELNLNQFKNKTTFSSQEIDR